ncbi:MAG: SMC family ATPase [Chloroflexi bacterium]|nr:SMC family ATPase [Chloroflexota bacterium]
MIPVRLKMQNFMCYRDPPPLLFDGIHTAVISGDNGNGKSALIDAITWALWGKTRAKSDDDLVFQGQNEMAVEFDFTLAEQVYRVLRKRDRTGRHRPILELQVAGENGFKPISGSTIAETEKKIIDILRMDYETFTNSAYLRQGNADQFTRQQPARRKEVLAAILNLSLYDELEEIARERARQRETEMAQLENALKEIDSELAQKPACEAKLIEIQGELATTDKLVKEQEARLNSLRQKREVLEGKRAQLSQADDHISGMKRDIAQWEDQAKQHRSRVKDYEELMAQRSVIEDGYAQQVEAKKLYEELNLKLRQMDGLNRRRQPLERAIDQAQATLLTEHRLSEQKIKEDEARSEKLPRLKDELRQAESLLSRLSEQEAALASKRQSCKESQAKLNHMESSIARLEQEIPELEKKLNMLLTQHEAKCPLCETELGAEGIKLIETKYHAEREQKTASLKSERDELARHKTEVKSLEGEVSRLEQHLNRESASFQGKAEVLKKQIEEAEEAASHLSEEKGRLDGIEQRLARKDFAVPEQEALARLEAELAKISYDSEQHEQVRHRVTDLAQYESSKRRLEEADRLVEQEKEAASRAETAGRELCERLEVQNRKREELEGELKGLPALLAELNQSHVEYQAAASRQREAQKALGSVEATLKRLSEQEERKKEKLELLAQSSKEEGIYKGLVTAFGKKGIQAMLIETALPEIEEEANKLLARMTDNRMHLKFETQKESKKGDTMETLDITIADELGTRNYEMFSGGEAFRINFAIRIALSKLLARRAGAPLRTLIVDEGFGTQDSTGIEKIKEAINSIQDDFDKTLVITHIDELRDAFPTRIDVVKTAEGSTVEVS